MARPKWWYGPEYRKYSNPPLVQERPIANRSADCNGCPFPASGFICWSETGDCMKTRIERLSTNSKREDQKDEGNMEGRVNE